MRKITKKKKSAEYKCIRVKSETYRRLIQTKGAYEMMFGEPMSIDDIICALLDAVPKARASVEVVAEAAAESEET